jgi:hypothetical protein
VKPQLLITIALSALALVGCDRFGGGVASTDESKKQAIYKWANQDAIEAFHHRNSYIPRNLALQIYGLNDDKIPENTREAERYFSQRIGQRFLISQRYFHKHEATLMLRNKFTAITFTKPEDLTSINIHLRVLATCKLKGFEQGRAVFTDCSLLENSVATEQQNMVNFVEKVKAGETEHTELQRVFWGQYFLQNHLGSQAKCYENLKSWDCQQELNKIYSNAEKARDIQGNLSKKIASLKKR